MANEKRLIDANKLSEQMAATFEQCAYEGVESAECQIALDTISEAPPWMPWKWCGVRIAKALSDLKTADDAANTLVR